MTTVVALAREGSVFMAADTATNVYNRPLPGAVAKIRRIPVGKHSEALIGFAGAGELPSLVERHLELKKVASDVNSAASLGKWAAETAEALTAIGYKYRCTDDRGDIEATMLLGYEGILWTVTQYQAIMHPDGIAAIGSGEGIAIGVVDALLDLDASVDPRLIVEKAVTIACRRDKHSALPMQGEVLLKAST